MTSVPRYSHSPIESTDIRLLRFLKADKDGVSAELQKFSLSPASQPPPAYTALSYVWSLDDTAAEPARSGHISIDGQQLPILDSLKDFLQILQTKERLLDNSWWWIDSICINQEDSEEKNRQVALMQAIYRRAGITIVWLGESSADSDNAMDFILAMWHIRQKVDFRTAGRTLQLEQYSSNWEAVENLFERRWWTRVWTVQEFVLARYLSFWCGLKTVRRIEVGSALQLFHNCRPKQALGLPAFQNSWHRNRIHEWYRKYSTPDATSYFRMSLAALASFCSTNNATDDKDLLYGLSALTPDIQFIKIDYDITAEEAYIKFTKSHIEHYKSLDIICFAHVHCDPTSSLLPTWVPDWRTRLCRNLGITPVMVAQSSSRGIGNFRPLHSVRRDNSAAKYIASGYEKLQYEFEGLNLVVRGFVLDTIDGLGGSGKFELFQSSESLMTSTEDINLSNEWTLDCVSSVLRCLVLGRRDRYLQDSVIPEEFVEDFQNFCFKAIQNKHSELPLGFREWFDKNRLLRIHGYPLESIIQYTAPDQKRILDTENRMSVIDIQVLNTFSARFYDAVVRISRRLMIGKNGFIGMAPGASQAGDIVCILLGCSVPVVLRKAADETKYLFIGECFVDGYMSGEAVGDDRFKETSFCIS